MSGAVKSSIAVKNPTIASRYVLPFSLSSASFIDFYSFLLNSSLAVQVRRRGIAQQRISTYKNSLGFDEMNFSGFDQAKNFAFGKAGQIGDCLRQSHLDECPTGGAKRRPGYRCLPDDNGFFDFKNDFHFLFHFKKPSGRVLLAFRNLAQGRHRRLFDLRR